LYEHMFSNLSETDLGVQFLGHVVIIHATF
jgi:hypothetical protein